MLLFALGTLSNTKPVAATCSEWTNTGLLVGWLSACRLPPRCPRPPFDCFFVSGVVVCRCNTQWKCCPLHEPLLRAVRQRRRGVQEQAANAEGAKQNCPWCDSVTKKARCLSQRWLPTLSRQSSSTHCEILTLARKSPTTTSSRSRMAQIRSTATVGRVCAVGA